MIINKKRNNNTLIFQLEGKLDSTNNYELEDALKDVDKNTTELIFDFAKLSFISSAGLSILLKMQKKMNKQGKMKIKNVNEYIKSIFILTGFDKILTIE